MNILDEYRKLKIRKSLFEENLSEKTAIIESEKEMIESLTQARSLIIELIQLNQDILKEQIESLVTSCLQAVFAPRDFRFVLNFQVKRNKMECTPIVLEDGREMFPEHDMGGGVLDIISFALRIVFWSLRPNKTRPLLLLDEPFRFCGSLITKACEMVKQITKGLGIQTIIITHSDELIDIADRSWHVQNKNGRSIVIPNAD